MLPDTLYKPSDIQHIKTAPPENSLSFNLFLTDSTYKNKRLNQSINHKEALMQSIHKRLITEKGIYPIYSQEYGLSTLDLIGMPREYVQSEIKIRIKEALSYDDRIIDCTDFIFHKSTTKEEVSLTFTAHTIFGELNKEVNFNVRK